MVYMQFVNNAVNHEISMIYQNFNEVQDVRNVETKPLQRYKKVQKNFIKLASGEFIRLPKTLIVKELVGELKTDWLFNLQNLQIFEFTKNYQWHQVRYSIVPQNSVGIKKATKGKDRVRLQEI